MTWPTMQREHLTSYAQPQASRGRERHGGRHPLLPVGVGAACLILGLSLGLPLGRSLAAPSADPAPVVTTFPTTSATPTAPALPLLPSDVKLTVRETRKACFGTAGCSVNFKLDASWPRAKVGDGESYEVTYRVDGLEDPFSSTITIHDDSTFSQDSYQSGDKARSGTKLRAVVTDVRLIL